MCVHAAEYRGRSADPPRREQMHTEGRGRGGARGGCVGRAVTPRVRGGGEGPAERGRVVGDALRVGPLEGDEPEGLVVRRGRTAGMLTLTLA